MELQSNVLGSTDRDRSSSSRSSQSLQSSICSENVSSEESSKKYKLCGDEHLSRNRERNRLHAKNTRERKRTHTAHIQERINALYEEGMRLRQMVDERYTANSLLGLRNTQCSEQDGSIVPASKICSNYYEEMLTNNGWCRDGNGKLVLNDGMHGTKRSRRTGKFSVEERDDMRRERNRVHAKKTRERKKHFGEMSHEIISSLEAEISSLRNHLRSVHAITEDEFSRFAQHSHQIKQKICELEKEVEEEDEESEGDGDDGESSADDDQAAEEA